MVTTGTAQDLLDATRRAHDALAPVRPSGVRTGTRDEWVEALGALQSLLNEATALQDEVVVELAALEPEWAEDGTVRDVRRALDAPAIVSGVLCLSAVAAEQRVRDAVRRAADGPEGTPTSTGLGGLHTAMTQGRLDGHRAHVVSGELEECPAEVRATVVAALDPWLDREDGSRLRRRVRRMLAAIDPDLLRQRARRAREASGLRRWVDEPGVDTWLGTFPSEEACGAWAAVGALAQRYLEDGVCARIDRARAKALTDLVLQQSTVTTTVVEHHAHPLTGALVDDGDALATPAYRPGAALAGLVRARDRHCRFPGCSVAARWCDLDHVVPWPAGPTSAANLVCLCRRHHRTKQRPGWRTLLAPDGTYTVTDPTGRVRSTDPPDHRADPALSDLPDPDHSPPPACPPRVVVPDGPHSDLEHALESRLGGERWGRAACRVEVHRPARVSTVVTTDDHPRRPRPTGWPDTPPL
ncbi:HNH endonuclease signature motif containing protein [Arthrobacter sp. NEB 688]|uniref:HNH endonuclease signature motif containing protein n=1 Tax=Arthrobacter sp. NEB 688 TaxID=904039 RepID=UPI00156509FE|nr:HNH endonuclease signature motif containing protein [Arthrobacter sp. NEB 688]QKE83081.1 HNH endonuclease [Arthrobacter sp. NEB 688]